MTIVPFAASALVPVANLPTSLSRTVAHRGLAFSVPVLIDVLAGRITRWNDPALVADNPGILLPNATIVVVANSDPLGPAVLAAAAQRLAYKNTWDGTTAAHDVLSPADALAEVEDTPFALTAVASQDLATVLKGLHHAWPVELLSDGFSVPYSLGSVENQARVASLDSKIALVKSVVDAWPLTFLEWAAFPSSLDDVSPDTCTMVLKAIELVGHALTSPYVRDRAWEYGVLGLEFPLRHAAWVDLSAITCNGVHLLDRELGIVHGSGATEADALWIDALSLYNVVHATNLLYDAHGSGVTAVDAGVSVFGGSDHVMSPDEIAAAPDLVELPFKAMAISLPYSIQLAPGAPARLPTLVLSRSAVAGIFSGRITTWSHRDILDTNPVLGPYLPNATLCVYVMSGPSGATEALTSALSAIDTQWSSTIGTVNEIPYGAWPGEDRLLYPDACVRRASSPTVMAQAVDARTNAIGYVAFEQAHKFGVATARMVNALGDVVGPSSDAVAAAVAAHAEASHLAESLADIRAPGAWPLSAFTFAVFADGRNDHCLERRVFARALAWLVASEDAKTVAASHDFVQLDNITRDRVLETLGRAECGGVSLMDACADGGCESARPSESKTDLATLLPAVLVPVVVLIACATAVVIWVVLRRDVVFKLAVDEDLVIPLEELDVLSTIGTGSFGTVYSVKWRGSPMAVKHMHGLEVDHTKLAEFADEASVLMKLRHPNILLFMGITIDPAGLVTEYMPNGSLYSVLHDYNLNLEPNLVMWWAHSIALGLDFLQHSGIVHRDMKSLNVLLDAGYVPKICDFGLSSAKDDANAGRGSSKLRKRKARKLKKLQSEMSRSRVGSHNAFDSNGTTDGLGTARSSVGSVGSTGSSGRVVKGENLGSLLWTAPEILNEGVAAAATASDVFAFAVTMWELLTRSDPYPGVNPMVVAVEVAAGARRPSLSVVPDWAAFLIPLLSSGWEQDPKARPTFGSLAQQLASRYIPSQVVVPRRSEDPSGAVVVVRVSVANLVAELTSEPGVTEVLLLEFFEAVGAAVSASRGILADSSISDVLVVFQVVDQVVVFLETLATQMSSPQRIPFVAVAARGEISTQAGIRKTFSGPAIESLGAAWVAAMGLCPKDSGGMFVAPSLTPDLVGALDRPHALLAVNVGTQISTLRLASDAEEEAVGTPTGTPTGLDAPFNTMQTLTMTTTLTESGNFGEALLSNKSGPMRPLAKGSLSLWAETPSPFLMTLPQVQPLIDGGVVASQSTYAKMIVTNWNGQSVCVKLLVDQQMRDDALVYFASGIGRMKVMSDAMGAERLLAPLAVSLSKPYVGAVFPFHAAGSLSDLVGDTGAEPSHIRDVLRSMATALAAMHNAGFSHGSLKPNNVLLTPTSHDIVLADAGFASIKTSLSTMTMSPSVSYMAPELLQGAAEGAPSDIFALGSVIYEVVTGQAAFSGGNAMQVAHKILNNELPSLDALTPRLANLLLSAWVSDPSQRASINTIVATLDTTTDADFTL